MELKVDGAKLYYEVQGAGPVLLLICGGVYDAAAFGGLVAELSGRYTVVTYDRRGNSRSPLDGAPEIQDVAVHAEDAYRVLQAVGAESAYVFGNSSGAEIGMELAVRHPSVVRALVAHEPPVFDVLPEREHWQKVMQEVEDTFAAAGTWPALGVFNEAIGMKHEEEQPQGELPPEIAAMMGRMEANMEFFIGYEVPAFGRYSPDVPALKNVPVVLAAGETSKGEPPHEAAVALAALLGGEAEVFPGDHGGFGVPGFGAKLHEVLSRV